MNSIRFSPPMEAYTDLIFNVPGIFPLMKAMASRWPFFDASDRSYELYEARKELGPEWGIRDVEACGICGTDKAIVSLGTGDSVSEYMPDIVPKDSSLVLKALSGINDLVDIGKPVARFPLGHEIALRDGVIYPMLSCETKLEQKDYCEPCRVGKENECQNLMEGSVRGLSLGFGAVTESGFILPGGMSERIVAHDSQVIRTSLSLEQKVLVDAYACSVNSVEMADIDTSKRILVAGMGPMGFTVLHYLLEQGYDNVTVIAKYDSQYKMAGDLIGDRNGIYSIIRPGEFRGKFDAVFDCVGTRQSMIYSTVHTKMKGRIIDLGLASFYGKLKDDGLQNTRAQSENDFHGRSLVVPFWATKKQFHAAINSLSKINETARRYVAFTPFSNAREAFFPEDREYVKYAILFF